MFRLEYAAFCETNRDAYLRYAQTRLMDQAEARRCVDTVLATLGAHWIAALGCANLAAQAWGNLRTETHHRALNAEHQVGNLYALLRDDQADIMLLRHHLGLPLDDAARLMGLANHDAQALLRGAERDLGNLLSHGEQRARCAPVGRPGVRRRIDRHKR
ncbi:hypothetical protein [Streptomyces buecherae]|uniref:hypothetical protein n=1 Tax=Streptomyces buecherae TaxID=2763006 RepID=UPI001C25D800|nr:hypothetical protein [Streptomyces buecherae]